MSRQFTVPILLPADPVNPLEAATKQYVDAKSAGAVDEVWVGAADPIATNPTIELWYDSDAVAPPGTGMPSAGVVYGVNMYQGSLAATTVISNVAANLITIAMPAAPAGTLLDISWVAYMNQGTVGTGTTFVTAVVNGVDQFPTIVVGDRVQVESYCGRTVNIAAPVNVPYNIALKFVKATAGGTIQAQLNNTLLSVVSYRP